MSSQQTESIWIQFPLPNPVYFVIEGKQYELPNVPHKLTPLQQHTLATESISKEPFNIISSNLLSAHLGQLRRKRTPGGGFPDVSEEALRDIPLEEEVGRNLEFKIDGKTYELRDVPNILSPHKQKVLDKALRSKESFNIISSKLLRAKLGQLRRKKLHPRMYLVALFVDCYW